MCLLLSLIFFGPRFVIIIYWLGWPARWELAFDSFLVPFAGFVIAPWTTLMYVGVAPGGVEGPDYLLLAIAVAADLVAMGAAGATAVLDVAREEMSGGDFDTTEEGD